MNRNHLAGLVLASLLLSACSSRPREFKPTLAAPAADPSGLDAAYAECRQLLVDGKLDSSGRVASGAAGVAAGATTAAVGAAAASSAGLYGGMAIASATVVLLPVALIGGAFGMSRIKRGQKEKAIKAAMSGCLQERGFTVAGWTKTGKKGPVVVARKEAAAKTAEGGE
jgi:hypothetical protein